MRSPSQRMLRAAAILAFILAIYIFNVERWRPELFFGRAHDDSLYFSSAKALAEGHGYVIASFPGAPPQTKYPIALPWLLEWVWKWGPAFPANLKAAVRITEFFGCVCLIASFALFRRLPGIGEGAAYLLTGVLAFQPIFLRMSGLIMSDVPFMALLLVAFAIADDALRREGRWYAACALGAIVGLSLGLRSIAVAALAGFLLVALWRRAWEQSAIFFGGACAAAGGIFIATRMSYAGTPLAMTANGGPGWRQLVLYYTSYGNFWRIAVPSARALIALVKVNFLYLLTAAGSYLATPFESHGTVISALLTVLIALGIVRQAREPRWQPILAVMAIYWGILLAWPWSPERFLLSFLTIFLAGLWLEGKRIVPMLRANLSSGAPVVEKCIAAALALVLVALVGLAAWNFVVRDPRQAIESAQSQAGNLAQREQAYAWIRAHTPGEARVIAYEDAVLYLYSERASLRPIAFSVEYGYLGDKNVLARDLAHMTDAAHFVQATYWLATDDDYHEELGLDEIRARSREIEAALPEVFRSSDGSVRVHDARCIAEPERSGCAAADAVLFPAGVQQR